MKLVGAALWFLFVELIWGTIVIGLLGLGARLLKLGLLFLRGELCKNSMKDEILIALWIAIAYLVLPYTLLSDPQFISWALALLGLFMWTIAVEHDTTFSPRLKTAAVLLFVAAILEAIAAVYLEWPQFTGFSFAVAIVWTFGLGAWRVVKGRMSQRNSRPSKQSHVVAREASTTAQVEDSEAIRGSASGGQGQATPQPQRA